MPELDPGARLRKAMLWLCALAFAILALARPQWGAHEETVKTTGLDIMVALDVSTAWRRKTSCRAASKRPGT